MAVLWFRLFFSVRIGELEDLLGRIRVVLEAKREEAFKRGAEAARGKSEIYASFNHVCT